MNRRPINRRMILMLLAVSLLLGAVFGYKAFIGALITDIFDNMPEPVATITATEAGEQVWRPQLEAVGSFAAVQGAELTTEVSGIVQEILFENGARVRAGEMLLRLDSRTDMAQLRRLEAAARLANLELERARRLVRQNNISEAEVQRRESEAEQAAAAVQEQAARIQQKTLTAPFSGQLGIRRVNPGQFLSAGDPVVSLQALDPIYLNFSLAERRIGEVVAGQPLQVMVDAYQDSFEGRVKAIEPAMQASTRTFEVQAILPNAEQRLRPGMFGRVTLDVGESATVVVVPQSAVSFNPYGDSVYVIQPGEGDELRVRQRFVRTGMRRGDLVVILEGLEPGERVATSGLLKLRNNAVVRISDDPDLQPGEEAAPTPPNA
ncbi:efflux RND transporter periplasmic adaptor subunit [Ectothiorhodospira lacustris]|uniref:efflux RND transporter periplasmic adaptor subunit n=1 Tax=Ectothiorhodospira lacustris TaxID=2899127 RepID=UPI001EE871A2|nr:efflux RND transporter periplasmic adaptor subunit [Ectothiorhodospira lacustris]MCG5510141.1 efflux RND transporter periplasmic adaptor subunit [Ectothiorhodospira lacustris]MCG5521984.1 efflux RND transporter periplasmic adaptor subunit [Ectothiorhodospira lacustris]